MLMAPLPESWTLVSCGMARTTIVNARVLLRLGMPLSATRIVNRLVLGAWAEEGVQVNRPPGLTPAPAGTGASRLKVSVCAGRLLSTADAVKLNVLPR